MIIEIKESNDILIYYLESKEIHDEWEIGRHLSEI
jgi:hypothetical protein